MMAKMIAGKKSYLKMTLMKVKDNNNNDDEKRKRNTENNNVMVDTKKHKSWMGAMLHCSRGAMI